MRAVGRRIDVVARRRAAAASRAFWDRAAREDAAWYIATGFRAGDAAFFAQGARETDFYLARAGVTLTGHETVVELGCGVGRMTRRLSELAATVVAVDVSEEMLRQCRRNLADRNNVVYLLVPGDGGLDALREGRADLVFSYITLQHVPSAAVQLRYLGESIRLLAPGGRAALQLRGAGPRAAVTDWLGHLARVASRRRTLNRAWRGQRLPASTLRRALAPTGAEIQLRPFGRRHLWVLATAPTGTAPTGTAPAGTAPAGTDPAGTDHGRTILDDE